MVHTLPDGTTKYKMVKIFGQIDTGELAARLGAFSTEDRRGNLVWADGFENGIINWKTSAGGNGAAVAVDDTVSWMGDYSLKLTTGDTGQDESYILKDFTIPSDTKIGLECHVRMLAESVGLEITLSGYNGTNKFNAYIMYKRSTNYLYYTDSAGGLQTLSTDALPTWQNHLWAIFKIVIDWETQEWIRVICGDTTYDLSGEGLLASADARHKSLQAKILFKTLEAANHSAWIDNIILTQNES